MPDQHSTNDRATAQPLPNAQGRVLRMLRAADDGELAVSRLRRSFGDGLEAVLCALERRRVVRIYFARLEGRVCRRCVSTSLRHVV